MTRMLLLATALIVSAAAAQTQEQVPLAASESEPDFVCFAAVAPVVNLDFPSRYTDDSKDRSDFDEAANAAVEAALGPVDDYIVDLINAANAVLAAPGDATKPAADCVVDRLHDWAAANALNSQSAAAQMSVPSRVGAMAMAYAQVRATSTADSRQPVIEAWLAARTQATMSFFDTQAPPRASQNNLRAWAALGVGQVGLILNDPVMLDWAAASLRLVGCTAAADGSLPNEMWRGTLALHYQLHAMSPLVVGSALLAAHDPDLFAACDGAISRAARFALRAARDPGLVQAITGKPQKFDPADLRSFEFAWITAYLTLTDDPVAAEFAAQFDQLSNSKLGGRQELLWK